jgi:hypothetical protein
MRRSAAALASQRRARHPANPIEDRLLGFVLIVSLRFARKRRANGLELESTRSDRNIAHGGSDSRRNSQTDLSPF